MEPDELLERANAAAEIGANIARTSVAGGGASSFAIFMIENAVVIGSVAGLVSTLGVIVGLVMNFYFKRRMLEIEMLKIEKGLC